MVTPCTGIVKFFPVPINEPPQLPVNHPNEFPTPPDADIMIVPTEFAHKLIPVVVSDPGVVGDKSTVTVLLTQEELVHPGITHLA